MHRIQVIDSHTGGEPTRVVIEGGPQLPAGATISERVDHLRAKVDHFRTIVIGEPRGSDVMVGALLCEPVDPRATAGVIFFNNVGYLGMCGHGTIGLIRTLAHLKRIQPGEHLVETPVGMVKTTLSESGVISVENVPSYRLRRQVEVDVEEYGTITGDIAWGGNWFFLCEDHGQEISLQNVERLTDFTWRIRQALEAKGMGEPDHVELFGPSQKANSKNFVLCPGKAYDRSPCGTGTSAKLACLAADEKLYEGEIWSQESIVGSVFQAFYRHAGPDRVIPTIRGDAFITAEASLILEPFDPFAMGIRK